jgi:DNA-binding XRE family transcriptional regulator
MKQITTKDFKIARAEMDNSAEEVAQILGVTRQYIYEVIKYPNKNPKLHRQIAEYCNSAKTKAPDQLNKTQMR